MNMKIVQKEIELQSRGWIPTFHDVGGDVMEGGDPAAGLQFDFLLYYFEIHLNILQLCKNNESQIKRYVRPKPYDKRRSFRQPSQRGQQPWQHRKKNR